MPVVLRAHVASSGFSAIGIALPSSHQVLPKLDGVVSKLQAGAKAADIGCGAGVALVEMAEAFPQSAFHGYDISRHALARAEKNKK